MRPSKVTADWLTNTKVTADWLTNTKVTADWLTYNLIILLQENLSFKKYSKVCKLIFKMSNLIRLKEKYINPSPKKSNNYNTHNNNSHVLLLRDYFPAV